MTDKTNLQLFEWNEIPESQALFKPHSVRHKHLLDRLNRLIRTNPNNLLSKQEHKVFKGLLDNKSYTELSKSLKISKSSIQVYYKRGLNKLIHTIRVN